MLSLITSNSSNPRMEELRLRSPVGAGREFDLVYTWPTEDSHEKYSEEDLAEEIRDSISAVLPDHPGLVFRIPPVAALKTYDRLRDLCNKWNFTVKEYVSGKEFPLTKASLPQAQHIIGQVYNKSVVCPERLNQYTAFSSHVYGETSPKMVSHMIKQLRITSNDIFLDLGSGVGQVVLQMAAAANFKLCIGIETCEVPCEYAVGLETEFRRTMTWYGKYYSNFRLYKGDFLEKPYREVILKSTIIFVNNFAFGPEVDHNLKEIFADLDDGVRIISSKEFSSANFRINQRNLSDIGTIMNVSQMKRFEGAVSWTSSKVSFFLHVIDRSKLERYFEGSKQIQQHTQAVEKPRRKPVSSPSDRPGRKRPRPKFQISQRKKKKDKKLRNDTDYNQSTNSAAREVKEPIENKLEPENCAKIERLPQGVMREETFKVPLQPIPRKQIATHSNTRKRKPPTDSGGPAPNPSPVDLNHTSSLISVASTSSQQPVDIYANAPWRNVTITPGPPKCVDELLARMRVQYFAMIDAMKSRSYVEDILVKIKAEKERNECLRNVRDRENKIVSQQLDVGKQLLAQRLTELGIDKDEWQSMFTELQGLVQDQTVLSMKKTSLEKEISQLEKQGEDLEKHSILCGIYEEIKIRRMLGKQLTSVTCELHEIEGKTPPSFPDSPNSDCGEAPPVMNFYPHPGRLYVNEVRSGFDEFPHQEVPTQKTASYVPPPRASIATSGGSGTKVSSSYKIPPSSILPKKRR